jgi:Flp pilus assembly protein TadB
MAEQNGNGINIGLEVLAERIANLSKKLDEQLVVLKVANDAALTAISVAKTDQERTVTVAFASSQLAISKTEQSQKESNQKIGALENEVVRLAVTQAQTSGKSRGVQDMYGYIFGFVVAITAIASVVFMAHK